jgi:hypothetical protein
MRKEIVMKGVDSVFEMGRVITRGESVDDFK